jgi:hypothetical protein
MENIKTYTLNKNIEKKLISRMINSICFFLNFVFILKDGTNYRLVAIQSKQKIIDMKYKTLKGAKIACIRILRNQLNNKKINAVWSFLYPVDEKWLKDKLNRKEDSSVKQHLIARTWQATQASIA